MGDPKFSRRKYDTPSHPWQGERIKEENELLKKYGLKNKKELWKAQSLLRNYRRLGRELLARLRFGDVQAEKERKGLLTKLANLGVLPDDASLDDVLSLDVERILDRRLQTLVYIKGLSYTPKQARQLIVHGHALVNERKVTVPGYLVKRSEEPSISYNPYSPIAHELHPARPTSEHVERITREFAGSKEEKTEEGFKDVIPEKPKEEKKTDEKTDDKKDTEKKPEGESADKKEDKKKAEEKKANDKPKEGGES
jgi:small subunit ribosomal protein S4